MRKTLMVLAVIASLVVPGFAFAQQGQAAMKALQRETVDAMQKMPIQGLQMVESEGRVFFVSLNGRYVIKGDLFDMWTGQQVSSVASLNDSSGKIDFEQLGLDVDELFALTYGDGPKEVVMFTSPGCPYCKRTIDQMHDLTDQYTFKLVPLPILGEASANKTKQLVCAAQSDPEKAVQAVISENYGFLPAPSDECDLEGVRRSMVSAKILGIEGVPFIITPDSRVLRGAPKNLAQSLGGSK